MVKMHKVSKWPKLSKIKVFTTMIEGGLTEGSLGTSTTCYGTRYHAKNISWYHYTVFLGGTKISTDHFFTSFREILAKILKNNALTSVTTCFRRSWLAFATDSHLKFLQLCTTLDIIWSQFHQLLYQFYSCLYLVPTVR